MGSPDLACRLARRADLPAIMALLADDAFSRGREDGLTPAVSVAFDEIEADPNSDVYVMEECGAVVGCAQLTVIAGLSRRAMKRGLVEAVRIASDRRGRGLGRWFMDRIIDRARARGCGVIQLTSDKRRHEAHRFYLNLGFEMP